MAFDATDSSSDSSSDSLSEFTSFVNAPRTSKVWLEQFLLLGILFYLHQMKACIHNDMVHFYARYPWHIFGLRYEECLIPGIIFFINEIGNEVAGYSGVLSYMRNNVKHQPQFDRLV